MLQHKWISWSIYSLVITQKVLGCACNVDVCDMEITNDKCVDVNSENAKNDLASGKTGSSIVDVIGGVDNIGECCSICRQRTSCTTFSFSESLSAESTLLQTGTKKCILLSSGEYDTMDGASCMIGTYCRSRFVVQVVLESIDPEVNT